MVVIEAVGATSKLISATSLRMKYLTKIDVFKIDDWAFRLHRVTMLLLIVFGLLISSTQFFGKPISCIKGGDVPDKVLNQYCWIEGTFTLPKALIKAKG